MFEWQLVRWLISAKRILEGILLEREHTETELSCSKVFAAKSVVITTDESNVRPQQHK